MKIMSTALTERYPRKYQHVIDEIIKNKMTLVGNMYAHKKFMFYGSII